MGTFQLPPPDETAATDAERGWAVWRCEKGCVHVALERVVLTLQGDDLLALLRLLQRASMQLQAAQGGTDPQRMH